MDNNYFIVFFLLCFRCILMSHNMIILSFRLPYFHASNSALFFTLYFSTLISYRHFLLERVKIGSSEICIRLLDCTNIHNFMMTSSNGNIFRVAGLLCGHR